MKIIKKHIKGSGWLVLLSITLTTTVVLSQMLQPNVLKDIVNAIALGNEQDIMKYGVALVALAVVGLIAGVGNTFLAAKISQKAGYSLRREIFQTIQQFSFQNIEKFSAGNLVVRLTNDVQQVQNLIMMMLQALTRMPLMFLVSFIMALIILPQLWWVIILFVVLTVTIMGMTLSKLGPRFAKTQRLLERVNTIAKENFLGIRVVKSFVQEQSEIDKFTNGSDELARETIRIGYVFSVMMPLITIISDLATVVSVYLVGGMVDADPSAVSNIVAFVSYLIRISIAILIGGSMVSFASRAVVSLRRIGEVLETKSDLVFGAVDETGVGGSLAFSDVSFQYEDAAEPTLKNITFEIEPQQTVGIIGATGSGKTTLGQLIARIYDPQAGHITLGGQQLSAFSEPALKRLVAIVLQRPILFSGTIAENIRQGKADATYEEMRKAAHIAQAAEFIEALEDGYDAEVYQRGANFSGGQKQRISITRGVVGSPKVLILDDSTSALDANSEKLVKQAIDTKLPDTTKIIISQKISSIVHADKILVLDQGELVGTGTHKELVVNNEIYRTIYETQKGEKK